jgi:hypothetical protein
METQNKGRFSAFPVPDDSATMGVCTQQDGMDYFDWLVGQLARNPSIPTEDPKEFAKKVVALAYALVDELY